MRTRLGESRYLTNPSTGEKLETSVIRDEVYVPALTEAPYDAGEWGKYVFGAWLEEDSFEPGLLYLLSLLEKWPLRRPVFTTSGAFHNPCPLC